MTVSPWESAVACLACPHCTAPLSLVEGGVHCAHGHHFDLAREGYLHLLPGTGRRSGQLGDSHAMLRARREFLARGYYDPLADALARQVAAILAPPDAALVAEEPGCVVDAGCGEGFYLGRVHTHLRGNGIAAPPLIGVDVAKDAARLAAKAYPLVAFAVADVTARLPLRDACADILLSLFAPRNPAEFARSVRPHGRVLVVIPTEAHLDGLRAHVPLLRTEPDKREHIVERLASAFSLVGGTPLTYEITLTGADAAHLVAMGPSAHHLPEPQIVALAAHPDPITTLVSVELLTFQRER